MRTKDITCALIWWVLTAVTGCVARQEGADSDVVAWKSPVPSRTSGDDSVRIPGEESFLTPGESVRQPGYSGGWQVEHELRTPARLAVGTAAGTEGTAAGTEGRRIFVSDPSVGSVFMLDSHLQVIGELKGLDRPLGLAVGPDSMLYVGNDGRDNIEVYGIDGSCSSVLAVKAVPMPNDLLFEPGGLLVVADSKANRVLVLDVAGGEPLEIRGAEWPQGELRFPSALAVLRAEDGMTELYVADQGNSRVVVCDLDGRFRRVLGGPAAAFAEEWEGRFTRVQALDFDERGLLHVLDSFQHRAQILDRETGEYRGHYGRFGVGPDELNNPLDLAIDGGRAYVSSAGNGRVQSLTVPAEERE